MNAIVTIDEVTPWGWPNEVNFAAQVDPEWRERHMPFTLRANRSYCISFAGSIIAGTNLAGAPLARRVPTPKIRDRKPEWQVLHTASASRTLPAAYTDQYGNLIFRTEPGK